VFSIIVIICIIKANSIFIIIIIIITNFCHKFRGTWPLTCCFSLSVLTSPVIVTLEQNFYPECLGFSSVIIEKSEHIIACRWLEWE
jgi:hypothetical protein